MKIEIMRDVLTNIVKEGQILTINFRGTVENLTGNYKLIELVRGRGRDGSIGMLLENIVTKERISSIDVPIKGKIKKCLIGTPSRDYIKSIVVDGQVFDTAYEIRGELPPSRSLRRF